MLLNPGDRVRIKANPGKVGIVGSEVDGSPARRRVLVIFHDGDEQFILQDSLEKVEREILGPYKLMQRGQYGRVRDLRGGVTYFRLSGKLANLIYSLNTTNTQFLAYQFKPVLHFLESPCRGILIADEVGLGKTIEAGLIWTELRARVEARRLLIICPAMLREKWKFELSNRFGVRAEIVDAGELLDRLANTKDHYQEGFALIASMQGIRPGRGWDDIEDRNDSDSARLARYFHDAEGGDALFDLVVIDEAHYLRNRETRTHKLGQLIRPVAENLVLLSATPIQLRSTDLYHLLNLLDEDAFPFETSFVDSLTANAPIVRLRDKVLSTEITRAEFLCELNEAASKRIFNDNAQIKYLIANPPSDEELSNSKSRSEIGEYLDKLNPLAKVVSRTRKRDVSEMRVVRDPFPIKVEMSFAEREFYAAVTEHVRQFCRNMQLSTGFMLTIPQRQMSSSMAAACQGWLSRLNADDSNDVEETIGEVYGDSDSDNEGKAPIGTLVSELVDITREIGDYQTLRCNDSKYAALIKNLKEYWNRNPRNKVVLFSFYRKTLEYLKERLAEDQVPSVIVYGGMDKQAALKAFADPKGPNILISSEVASEGVDLQFSSLLINYDLPWNPMRIEQRIDRIDRIGQEAEKILIWNFMYADTIDEHVYDRLLDRLDIFKRALGSIEAILGEQIRELGFYLLTHTLTPEQEKHRIDQAKLAIENVNRSQELLESEATQLIAHGDYIQNRVRAAKDLCRYVSGEDLLAYVKDFFDRSYSGTRFISSPTDPREYRVDLSTQGRIDFGYYVTEKRLQGQTSILSDHPPSLYFENRLGGFRRGVEVVTQDHPLVRFVGDKIRASTSGPEYFPVTAAEISHHKISSLALGVYVYAVSRWTFTGSRDVERLEYLAIPIQKKSVVLGEDAERLVNLTAMEGSDWLGVTNCINSEEAAEVFDECRNQLEDLFNKFRDAYKREDLDRINLMVNTLERHRKIQKDKTIERIKSYRLFGNDRQKRMIPAEEGRLKKQDSKLAEKISALKARTELTASASFVSGGVIRIF